MKRNTVLFITIIIAMLVVGCSNSTTTPPTGSAQATATPPPGPLTMDMLRSAKYGLPFYGTPEAMQNGRFYDTDLKYTASMLTLNALGDLNGDGVGDAAVIFGENYGQKIIVSLNAMLSVQGQPVQNGSVNLGNRVQVTSVSIENQRILLEMKAYGPNDTMDNPSIAQKRIYFLAGPNLLMTTLNSIPGNSVEHAITLSAPAAGSSVSAAAEVAGSISVAPFENTLTYVLLDANGKELERGPLTIVVNDPNKPVTFNVQVPLDKVTAGAFYLQIGDVSAANGEWVALETLSLIKK